MDEGRLLPSAEPAVACEVVEASGVREGDRIEFPGDGAGYRTVTRVEVKPDRPLAGYVPLARVLHFTGPAVETTRGARNWRRVKMAGQVVRRAV